ncbi:MAG TPA: hemolysin family protein [Acidimicrobiales bacterium]|nr:hemolysin family protein [Acidimicrobiales bacterium]
MIAAAVTGVDWVLLALVVVLLAASAGLAMAETSLVRTTKAKAKALEDEGRRGSHPLVGLVEHPQRFLNAVLLLLLVCQLLVATIVGILANEWFGAWGVVVAIVFEIVVIFVLAEALPKNWAVRNPERSALTAAPVVSAVVSFPPVRFVTQGLVALADLMLGSRRAEGVSESELLALADVALEEEVIEREERALIHSIIEFGDTIVREVMVPRPDMRTVEADLTVSQALGVAMAAGYSRLPAFDENVDDVIGIAYVKDLVRVERAGRGGDPVSEHVRPGHFVPETKRVADLMREMQERKYHQAIVVDEYGGTAGLVTLEDLIEELVGEIVDEYDVEEAPIERLGANEFSVSARLALDELDELIETELPSGSWDTVGGLLINLLGHVPGEGEAAEAAGVRLSAERVTGNRVVRIRIVVPARAEVPAADPAGSAQDR